MPGMSPEKENIFDVWKRYRILGSIIFLLFGAVLCWTLFGTGIRRDALYSDNPSNPVLTPVFLDEGDGEQNLGYVLQETQPVTADYFVDAVFVGDSFTEAFKIYDFLEDFETVAYIGVNTESAMTDRFYELEDGRVLTMAEAITYLQPRKIYIMLGANGINWETPEWLIEHYDELTDIIEAGNPDAYIILESIPATTLDKSLSNDYLALENILRYNMQLEDMALRKGYYFLDVYDALCYETGYLPDHLASRDGVHFNREGYEIWYNYIITHTIKGESFFSFQEDGRIDAVTG